MTVKTSRAPLLRQDGPGENRLSLFPTDSVRLPAGPPPAGALQPNVRLAAGLAFDQARSIAFVSANPGEGSTTSATALAASLAAHFEARTLLVDGNLRHPALHALFGQSLGPGLSDLLCDSELGPEQVIRPTSRGHDLLTAGACRGGLRRLSSDAFPRLLADLKDVYDYVLCDLAAVSVAPETPAAARAFDGAALVLECGKTRRPVAQSVKERLEMAGARILGVVLNKRRYLIPQSVYDHI